MASGLPVEVVEEAGLRLTTLLLLLAFIARARLLAVAVAGGVPPGIVLPALPPYYTTLWVSGAPYYYANGV